MVRSVRLLIVLVYQRLTAFSPWLWSEIRDLDPPISQLTKKSATAELGLSFPPLRPSPTIRQAKDQATLDSNSNAGRARSLRCAGCPAFERRRQLMTTLRMANPISGDLRRDEMW